MNTNFDTYKFKILETVKKNHLEGKDASAWKIGNEHNLSVDEIPSILQQLTADGLIEFNTIGSDNITITQLGLSKLEELILSQHRISDLPLGSNLPFLPNPLFIGREPELRKLAESLIGGSKTNTIITQAVTGMGGLGKTQLAIEFGYRYGKYFRGVHWLNLSDPSQLETEIANCGRQMALPNFPDDQPSQVMLTLQTWKANGPNLLILDNFEEPAIANDILAKLRHSNIRILVTSRRTDWPPSTGLSSLQLDLFSLDESLQFLKESLTKRKDDSDDDLKTLAERLGQLPLGLELASRYLNDHPRLSIKDYLKQTEEAFEHPSMKNWRADLPAATKHDLDLQRTFALSWDSVKDETAKKVLMIASFLAPNTAIPLEIFETAIEISQNKCDEVLSNLYGLGLLNNSEGNLPIIHPLLAEYVRKLSTKEINKTIIKKLLSAVELITRKLNDKGIPSEFLPIKGHLPVLVEHALRAEIELSGILWTNFGYYLKMTADYIGARKMFERALSINEKVFGPNHPSLATDINNLASLLKDIGELSDAKSMFEQALKIDESNFGSHHPIIAIRLNNLGSVMRALGDLKGAREMFKRAIKIWEANNGKEHPQVAIGINNLGSVMQDLGDLNGARTMLERALRIDETNFGPHHPSVARDVNNLGNIFKDMGDLNGARMMFERALKIDETNFYPDHPNIALRVSNLGHVMKELGDLNGAREMYARALKIYKNILPTDHPSIKAMQINLDSLNKSK